MNWLRLKKKICLQPELIDPYRSVSYEAARKMWKELGRPTALELLEGARLKAGIALNEWETIPSVRVKTAKASKALCISKRLVIACAIVLLLLSFIAFTVPGQALAKEIYRTFSMIIDNMLYVRSAGDLDSVQKVPEAAADDNSFQTELSLTEAQSQLDSPIIILDGEDWPLKSINVTSSRIMGESVESEYQNNGTAVVLAQRWPLDGQPAELNLSLENALYHTRQLKNGLSVEGGFIEDDQTYMGGGVLNGMVFTIAIDNVNNLADVETILDRIDFYMN
jgi:hypothetical protein